MFLYLNVTIIIKTLINIFKINNVKLLVLINKSNIRSIPYSSLVADSVMCADLLMNNLKI